MKDYLKCPLSQEERDLITAIIWITARDYKKRMYKRSRHVLLPIDDIEISVEDEYDFFGFQTRGNSDFANPIDEYDKISIVDYVDDVLLELSLDKFKIALTFDEKLVLFLCFFKHYSEKKAAYLLQVKIRRIKYLKESYKLKKEKYLGGLKNV
ncbi:MAG: hypothetical protein ACI4U9_04935 [Clostridia bacterium]